MAQIISVRSALGLQRQIFFVSLGGFDTHSDQLNAQNGLYTQLSQAMNAFYQATVEIGAASQVTSFTLSDFSRTYQPDSTSGTDHAWGGHHLIMGGGVHGGDFFGTFPTLALGGPGRCHQRRTLDSDNFARPVRRDSGELVRSADGGSADHLPEPGELHDSATNVFRVADGGEDRRILRALPEVLNQAMIPDSEPFTLPTPP